MAILTEQNMVATEGKKPAVAPRRGQFEQLLEDLSDLAMLAERAEKALVSLEAMKRRLAEWSHLVRAI